MNNSSSNSQYAHAVYTKDAGEKSAIVLIKTNPLSKVGLPVYVNRADLHAMGFKEGDVIKDTIPANFKTQDWKNEDGTIRTTKDGIPLQVFVG